MIAIRGSRALWWKWGLLATALALPYLAMMVLGSIWLWERGWFLPFAIVTAVVSIAAWWGMRRAARNSTLLPVAVDPEPDWARSGQDAWGAVRSIADKIGHDHPAIDDPRRFVDLFQEVIRAVAKMHYPTSAAPEIKVTVPQVLKLVEQVAADLRGFTLNTIPGSHLITIENLKQVQSLAGRGQQFYDLYRILSFAVNPIGAALRETNTGVSNQLMKPVLRELQVELIRQGVLTAGKYAIDLYGGRLILTEADFQRHVSGTSGASNAEAAARLARRSSEPYRVLIAGQVNAGKSRLINVLTGREHAGSDPAARTEVSEPFRTTRPDGTELLLFDTAGYGGGDDERRVTEAVLLAASCDAVIVVVSAVSAARAPDRRFLERLRAWQQENPEQPAPGILVVITHVDRLRPFNEWSPPYPANGDERPKGQTIKAAVAAVSQDLNQPPAQIVPVGLIDPLGNVEERLRPALDSMLAGPGERTRLQRAMSDYNDAQKWPALKQQAINSGKLIAGAAMHAIGKISGALIGSSPAQPPDAPHPGSGPPGQGRGN